jgi:long-chain acyl-CoA synthetase
MRASISAPAAGAGAPYRSIVHLLLDTAKRTPRDVALREKVGGRWREITWPAYAGEVRSVARGLIRLGIEPGQSVCIVGWNSPEWLVADLAVMAVGAVPAPLYENATAEQAAYVARHCEARLLFADSAAQIDKLRGAETIRQRVQMKGAPAEGALSWDGIKALGAEVDEAQLEARLAGLEPRGLATLVYTSGTTGPPKGVMLTHRNLAFMAASAAGAPFICTRWRIVSAPRSLSICAAESAKRSRASQCRAT